MQIISKQCYFCEDKIIALDDGNYCAKCTTTYHNKCLPDSNNCPVQVTAPEDLFIIYPVCPVCGLGNLNEDKDCENCGSHVYSKSVDEHNLFMKSIWKEAVYKMTAGALMFMGGSIYFITIVVMMVQ